MKVLKIFLLLIGIIVFLAFSLEAVGKVKKCPALKCSYPCGDIHAFLPRQPNPDLENLKQEILSGQKISKEEYRLAADNFVLEKDAASMGCYNGISCGDIAYVRSDLPKEAKKYVKRHELEHLLINANEYYANMAAAKEYPLGLLQVVFFSVKTSPQRYNSPLCYFLNLWNEFKLYFLPH